MSGSYPCAPDFRRKDDGSQSSRGLADDLGASFSVLKQAVNPFFAIPFREGEIPILRLSVWLTYAKR